MDHETLNDTMEDMAIVIAILAVYTEVLDRFGTFFEKKLQVDISHRCVYDGRFIDPLRS